ncbi:hypothetical protein BD410DRAFT_784939 [Rickenella mellea]|uniref:Uncharacterized protein n=1 Tax=Rickenella mellea TaxID=50990 RepID=A0A4Y7QCM6_9AGAM|nr:hypothetical protein BD410DRAFT_784939 [Rickenella mellea]
MHTSNVLKLFYNTASRLAYSYNITLDNWLHLLRFIRAFRQVCRDRDVRLELQVRSFTHGRLSNTNRGQLRARDEPRLPAQGAEHYGRPPALRPVWSAKAHQSSLREGIIKGLLFSGNALLLQSGTSEQHATNLLEFAADCLCCDTAQRSLRLSCGLLSVCLRFPA